MLTPEDLQQIQSLFHTSLIPIFQQLDSIEKRMTRMEKRMDSMEKRLDSVEKRLVRLEKKMDISITYLDSLYTNHQQRLRTLEKLQGIVVQDKEVEEHVNPK